MLSVTLLLRRRKRLLMFSSRSIMCLSHVLIIVSAFTAMVAAQLYCDPITQYEKDGKCCLKCDPGTHMSPKETCEKPECIECMEDEYQEKYTTATQCERQEYCDPNKNFKLRSHGDKKQKIPCLCEDGFHCSSETCLTCVPHRHCKPGYGARSIGNHTHDTVCQKCPNGEFSSNDSWNSVCQKWKDCEDNFYESKKGTGESDVECEPNQRAFIIPVVLISILTILGIIGVVYCIIYKRKSEQRYHNVNPKTDIEAHLVEKNGGKTLPDAEGVVMRTPVENEDHLSLQQPSLSEQTGVTANGNFVVQEMGKMPGFPRQESQTDTTESFCA